MQKDMKPTLRGFFEWCWNETDKETSTGIFIMCLLFMVASLYIILIIIWPLIFLSLLLIPLIIIGPMCLWSEYKKNG